LTPDLPVRQHPCTRNHEGSSKGIEARAALECVNKVWGSSEICIDDDISTRAYLKHSFEDLDALGLPRPATKTGKPKKSKKVDKGKLGRDHPAIKFLDDLCHRVRSFGKFLRALLKRGKKKSEMNVVNCLRLVAFFRTKSNIRGN
jgi:hypothetical protein